MILLRSSSVLDLVLVVVLLAVSRPSLARYALATDQRALRELTAAGRAHVRPGQHPVLLMNPKSGGGKVAKFNLVEEAKQAGHRSRSCSGRATTSSSSPATRWPTAPT